MAKRVRMIMTALCALLAVVLVTGEPGSHAAPTPDKPVKLNWLIVAKSASYLNYFVALQQGFFKQEGLDVQTTFTSTSELATQALIGGSGDISSITTDQVIVAVDKGADLQIVGAQTLFPPYTLVVRPDIKSRDQLKGKTFGQSNTRTAEVVFLRALLAQYGLHQGKDYTVIAPGSLPQRIAAIRAKAIDGSLLNEPYVTQLAKDGYVKLARADEVVKDYLFSSIVVRRQWAKDNRETLIHALRALSRATDWVYNPANKQAAVTIMKDVAGTGDEGAAAAYQDYVVDAKAFPVKGALNKRGMLKVMEFMKDSGTPAAKADPFEYVDTQYLDAANK